MAPDEPIPEIPDPVGETPNEDAMPDEDADDLLRHEGGASS